MPRKNWYREDIVLSIQTTPQMIIVFPIQTIPFAQDKTGNVKQNIIIVVRPRQPQWKINSLMPFKRLSGLTMFIKIVKNTNYIKGD